MGESRNKVLRINRSERIKKLKINHGADKKESPKKVEKKRTMLHFRTFFLAASCHRVPAKMKSTVGVELQKSKREQNKTTNILFREESTSNIEPSAAAILFTRLGPKKH